ncbi:MAG: hypothetical protein HY716_05365 [Planctomycetes bacterium]|nr:hypothetical protein [Planctomycetota bacterium]
MESVSTDYRGAFVSSPNVTPPLGKSALWSRVLGKDITDFEPDDLSNEVVRERNYLMQFFAECAAHMLLVSSYQVTKHISDGSPLWEFFRHVRNAAGHNGRLGLKDASALSKSPAEWRAIKLDYSMDGLKLIGGKTESALFYLGDPIILLWDIEQKYC